MTKEIQKIMQNIGIEKFIAIETDHGANLRIILENHPQVITNKNIFTLLQNEELIKLDAKINQIQSGNQWKFIIISNYNCHLEEFINSFGLKQTALNKIYETIPILWHDLGNNKESCLNLLMEMRSWKRKIKKSIFCNKNLSEDELHKSIDKSVVTYDIFENEILERSENLEQENLNESKENTEDENISTILNINQFTVPEFLSTGNSLFESITNRSNINEKK
ncbi:hypothetical protein Glove_346g36 [Diversispora epigaea]|uniref:Uncharacterized protein n=1 Tax=Diversispora epigaea TaxID=1348612 RepID=A0A397HF44_9GLOM|nr:hypothetical protein Glove_346g36 [Diversispora epigaea]